MIFFGQIVVITIIYVFIRVKTLSNTNYVVSRYIKRKKGSLPFDVRGQKRRCLNSLLVSVLDQPSRAMGGYELPLFKKHKENSFENYSVLKEEYQSHFSVKGEEERKKHLIRRISFK